MASAFYVDRLAVRDPEMRRWLRRRHREIADRRGYSGRLRYRFTTIRQIPGVLLCGAFRVDELHESIGCKVARRQREIVMALG